MPDEANKQLEPDTASAAPGKESFLGEKDEFCLLLKSIEENAKHAQTITFTLLGSCAYILLAVFITRAPNVDIKLPVINQDVPTGLFFAISPLVILIAYTYLHIYLRELRGRLEAADAFVQDRKLAAVKPDYLFFPWIVVFAHHYRNRASNSPLDRPLPGVLRTRDVRDLSVRVLTSLVLWFLGPFVLFVLWAQFVGERDAVSIIPCLCLVVSIVVARAFAVTPLRPVVRVFLPVLGIFLVAFTVSSVPALSSALGLDSFYTTVRDAWLAVKSLSIAWQGWILINFLGLSLLPMAVWLILRPFGVYTLRWRLAMRNPERLFYHVPVSMMMIFMKYIIWFSGFPSFLLFFFVLRSRVIVGIPSKVNGILLRGCNLGFLHLRNVSFDASDLTGADLSDADLRDANMNRACIRGAWFFGAQLDRAHLQEANASHAIFCGASLANTNLTGADLRGADFMWANLAGASLDAAKYSDSTKFPEGFEIPSSMIKVEDETPAAESISG